MNASQNLFEQGTKKKKNNQGIYVKKEIIQKKKRKPSTYLGPTRCYTVVDYFAVVTGP